MLNQPENSGVIPNPATEAEKQKQWIAGAETGIKYEIRISDGDWSKYKPVGVFQSIAGVFDTYACTHFAANQSVESQIFWLWENDKLSPECKEFLKGYCTNPEDYRTLVTSKRFNAIKGKNTPQGNWFGFAWDTMRKDGLIPESMLPFGGKNWKEYHDPALITPEMESKGKQFLEYFDIMYDQTCGFDQIPGFSESEVMTTEKLLKQCPINVGVPIPVNHSIILLDLKTPKYASFDHYVPYLRPEDKRAIGFGIRGVVNVKEKPKAPIKPVFHFTQDMEIGTRSVEVEALQQCLIWMGFLKQGLDTGFFGYNTRNAVIKLQETYIKEILIPAGVTKGTGRVREFTRAFLNKIFK